MTKKKIRTGPTVYERTVAALPGTPKQLAIRAGLAQSTVRIYIKQAHAAGECHISGWSRTKGWPAPTYTAGPGEDAPPLEARTNAEYLRKSKRRANQERAMLAAHRKAELQRIVIPTAKQSIFAALGL